MSIGKLYAKRNKMLESYILHQTNYIIPSDSNNLLTSAFLNFSAL